MAEADKEKLGINLHVYNEDISVTINREDEYLYRAAAKFVTDRYNIYAGKFVGLKNDHTIALMTLLDIGLSYQRERAKNSTEPYEKVLSRLTSEIEEALK